MDKTKRIMLALVVMWTILHMARCTGDVLQYFSWNGHKCIDECTLQDTGYFKCKTEYVWEYCSPGRMKTCQNKDCSGPCESTIEALYKCVDNLGEDTCCSPEPEPISTVTVDVALFDGVDGAVGDGRLFFIDSVDHIGWMNHVANASSCCKKCRQRFHGGANFIIWRGVNKTCYCKKRIPGIQPRTVGLAGYFSKICG